MAQKYGAAQGLIDLGAKAYRAGQKVLSYIPDSLPGLGGGKADTSWHDDMVKSANESFRKKAAKRKVGGTSKGTSTRKATGAPKHRAKKLVTKR